MSLNPDYIVTSSLEEYFVDPLTGTPLNGGQIYFYSDINRSTKKNIYTISGSPPDYNYILLPNPLTLSGTGTPQDESGNNVVIYYYPFDENHNVELYFIQVYPADGYPGNPILTRPGWPPANFIPQNITATTNNSSTNFIPNGQFLLHNNIQATSTLPAGQITQASTIIAEGGWSFERPVGTTSIDNVSFARYNNYASSPEQSPRFAVNIICSAPNPLDTNKSLRIKFSDVNKFSSLSQYYTISFSGIINSGSDITLTVNLVKNYGTGGTPSSQTVQPITLFPITSTQTSFSIPFIFGTNEGQLLGTNNDDYVAIDFSFPTNLTYNVLFTNFCLQQGQNINQTFPATTDRDFITRSLFPNVPNPDGYDSYLCSLYVSSGIIPDHSTIGNIYPIPSDIAPVGYLNCDGSSYLSSGYSSDGIPYRRLQSKLFINTGSVHLSLPMFGTGANFVTAMYNAGSTEWLLLSTNKAGIQTAVVDGANPTAFQFYTIFLGKNDLGFTSYVYGSPTNNQIWVINNQIGAPLAQITPSMGSGITFSSSAIPANRTGTNSAQQIQSLTIIAVPLSGSYLLIATPTEKYYVWFTINGIGTDPAIAGYTSIRIDLRSIMNLEDIAYAIALALSSYQLTAIEFISGSEISNGSYFTFYASSQLYYVWYSLNGTGIDPHVSSGIGIQVLYSHADSSTTIKDSTLSAINDLYFATPDLRNQTIKGYDGTGTIDLNSAYRYSNNKYVLPHYVGSNEFDMLLNHTHFFDINSPFSGPSLTSYLQHTQAVQQNTSFTGTPQNDVKNIYLNYVIKY